MPYVKHVCVHTTVEKSLRYILGPDKTEDLKYTAAINCTLAPHEVYSQMKMVYEQYTGHSFDDPKPEIGNGRVKAIHYIMSFADEENVTPELAHKIGKALVRKMFGTDVQAVIATHVDASYVHNHILINSYSISGQKFNANMTTLRNVREQTNGVCKAFGVTPALNFDGKGRSIKYNEWQHKKNGTSWKEHIRQAIEKLLPCVNSFEDLLSELERLSYTIKFGKYISVKVPEQKRAVRLKTLGGDYTEESLRARILWHMVGSENAIEHFTNSEIEQAYLAVIGEVRILAEQKRKVQRRQNTNAPYAPNNDLDIYRLSAQLTIINRDNISSIGELEGKMNKLSEEHKVVQEQLSKKMLLQEQARELIYQCEYYFANADSNDLKDDEEIRLDICKSSMQANDINCIDDVNALRQRNDKMLNEINSLGNSIAERKNMLAMYSDIRDTYYEISKGDYISKLVEEEKMRREQQKKKRKKIK